MATPLSSGLPSSTVTTADFNRTNISPMEWLTDPDTWIGLLTLTVLELVLGIDNIVFIAIISGKLRPAEQKKARTIGLSLAMLTRIFAAAFHLVDHWSDSPAIQYRRFRCHREDADSGERGFISFREKHPRDSRTYRRWGRTGQSGRGPFVARGLGADSPAGRGLFVRFGNYGRRHGR